MPSREYGGSEDEMSAHEFFMNGVSMKTTEVELKLDEGNILEAESSLREGLSLNYEEARALLGRLEYQRGNIQAALRVFDGIDLQAAIQRFQPFFSEKPTSKRGRSRTESLHSLSQHAASLVLEAIYLKSMSLQKLGRAKEAAQECKSVLDAVEKIFPQGIPGALVDNKLQETVSKAVELLPELWKQAGCYPDAIAAYRRALLSPWNLDNECCARIQKGFAILLLYGGVEASAPSLAVQIDGSFVPKNNLEEAILLLMILLRKCYLGKTEWDPTVMEHFTFALSLCGQTSILARQLEEVLPGMYPRCGRWNSLALCYSGAGQNKTALNLLRKSLKKHEKPDDPFALLLAAKICSDDCILASEGVAYARRAIANARGADEHLKGVGLRLLGICLGKQAKVASSDVERSLLQSEALKSLDEAISFERYNPDLIFELGIAHAEHRNANAALHYAKEFIDATGGSILKGWRLLALVLSAQHRYSEAEAVTDAALDETAKWEQGPLLRMKAKLKIAQSLPMDAVETYRFLLALVQEKKLAIAMEDSRPPHIAILPSPGMGHFIPLAEFARRLVLHHNFSVTFLSISTDSSSNPYKAVVDTLPKNVNSIQLPSTSLNDLPPDTKIETRIISAVAWSLPGLRDVLKNLVSTSRLVALVVDLFGMDAFDVAREFDIPLYMFFPSTAMGLSFCLHLPTLDEQYTCEYRDMPEPLKLTGCVPLHGKDFIDPVTDRKNEVYEHVLQRFKRYKEAKGVLVNSFVELEPGPLKALKEKEPGIPAVYPVGPLIQTVPIGGGDGSECLRWLSEQPRGSVLFVCFGSGGTLSLEQVNELALGLEMSEQRFLWVARSPNEKEANATFFGAQSNQDPLAFLPKGFLSRTKGMGYVVPSWAPQIQVLSHESTGGFLTHCGWNSTLESIVHGVPMIAWPLYAEQKMNAVMMVEDLMVALRPTAGENGIIGRAEIARVVKGLMEGEEGKRLRRRMEELKYASATTLAEGGSSYKAMLEVAHQWKGIKDT